MANFLKRQYYSSAIIFFLVKNIVIDLGGIVPKTSLINYRPLFNDVVSPV